MKMYKKEKQSDFSPRHFDKNPNWRALRGLYQQHSSALMSPYLSSAVAIPNPPHGATVFGENSKYSSRSTSVHQMSNHQRRPSAQKPHKRRFSSNIKTRKSSVSSRSSTLSKQSSSRKVFHQPNTSQYAADG